MKSVLLCLLILCFTVGCAKTNKLEPVMTVRELRNTLLEIQNCPTFIGDHGSIYIALTNAANAAGFTSYRVHSEKVDKDVWVMYIYADRAYAALWVNQKDKSCTLEFCSVGIDYCCADFLDTFMTDFYSIERDSEEWYKTFTELLE